MAKLKANQTMAIEKVSSEADMNNIDSQSIDQENDNETVQSTFILNESTFIHNELMWWDPIGIDVAADSSFKENVNIEALVFSKDKKISKLKAKIKKLKGKLEKLEELNSDLQHQLLLNSKKQRSILTDDVVSKSNIDVLKILKQRVASKLSDDNCDLVYPNGVKVPVKLSRILETISGNPTCDRAYINTQFFAVFSEKYIKKQVKKGLSRTQVLSKFRDSNRYATMKDLYEYRILCNGEGDIEARKQLFKCCFRTKLNNWWNANTPKIRRRSSD